jgi:replication factor A1
MEIEFAPHVDEIKRALDNEIDDNSIIDDLKKLLDYRVPIDEAKRSLIKKYGGTEKSIIRKLSDIESGDRNIEVTAQVLEITRRTINIKGSEKTIFAGIISDETAARSFTAWDDFGLNVGDVIRATHAYVRSWQDMPEINLGNRSEVTKLDISISHNHENKIKKLSEIIGGEVNIHTEFRILEIEAREITTKDGIKKILTGFVADKYTKIPLTSWVVLPELAEGNVVDVTNTYIRSFRGIPTLNISENSKVTKLNKNIEYKEPENIPIGELIKRDGAFDVTIEGALLSIRPGSGLVFRCPECSRVIPKSMCRVHGNVEEIPDMRIKAVIDDGTGALMLVLDAELTQRVCGLTIGEAQKIAEASMSQKTVEEEVSRKMFGKILSARGNMSKGDFGVILVAKDVWEPTLKLNERASELLGKIAG